ncbi:MAG: arylsulfatase [Verrucomicrobia bacterium]|nr:arylsulfatase [Verrucomicrobiota bacterium]
MKNMLRAGLILLLLFAVVLTTRAAAPPNILFILTDDQGYGDLSLHGNTQLQTPNIDRFAKQGIQFDRFYVCPLCAPTRASVLTGRYHLRGGVWGVTHAKETMRANEVTIAETLRSAGYRTGIFGKWHNGEHWPNSPQGQGFDEFFGFLGGHWNNYFDTELLRGTEFVKTRGFITDVLTDEAIAFIERNRSRPFLCYLPYNAPHTPYQAPDKYFDRFKAAGLSDELAAIYGMCANLDDNIGRLLARLDELKLAENTIVIFLTDNGPNGQRYNAGMRGTKGSVHEGGVRVPCFIRWPAKFKTPRIVSQIAMHIDLMPTLLDLCGVPPPKDVKFDGRSLRPLLEGNAKDWPERMLFTQNVRGNQSVSPTPGAVRSQQFRAVNEGKGWELFDMAADPGQKTNIAKEQPETLKRMSAAYDEWFRDVTHAGFAKQPTEIGHAEENPVRLLAPSAALDGGVSFFGKNGFANDWVTGWSSTGASVSWEIDHR